MAGNLNKSWYKLLLIILKVIPYIVAVGYVMYTLLSFMGVNVDSMGYFIHISILSWVFIYMCSWVFDFCIVHRIPLYYIGINDSISIIDEYIGIPISTFKLLVLHAIIIGVFIIIYAIIYVKNNKRVTT